ncbi:MAG TPA: YetF domain-containing protein [Verrucomicrobium sp.]|nr:YetF domain-containing protein [Verrucomicrobium sp.]
MWSISLPWWEFVIRGIAVYVVVLVMLRATGKRQVGQLSPFDLVLLLLLSNAVQNAMNGGDNSLTGGFILAGTLVGLNYLLSVATYKSRKLETLIEGKPQVLIHKGQVDQIIMEAAKLTRHELELALRRHGCTSPAEVRLAVLENNGEISVVQKMEKEG